MKILFLGWMLAAAAPAQWISLFDGATLNGWRVDRDARFTVEDGAIVGRQGPQRGPGGLQTRRTWSDFELELEWRGQGPLESGIWFRWTFAKLLPPTPTTACQADINDGTRADGILSGSLWCFPEGFVAANRDRASVVPGGWNRLRVLAVGPAITIEQNGKVVVRARDESCKAGSIGIQIPKGKKYADMAIYVRNIRIRSIERAAPSGAQ